MLLSRDDIRKDAAVDAFTDAILQRDQLGTAQLFFDLIRDGRTMGDALSVVTEAEAPRASTRSISAIPRTTGCGRPTIHTSRACCT